MKKNKKKNSELCFAKLSLYYKLYAMQFFEKLGIMAIGSRLRMLTDTITEDASQIYQLYGMDFKTTWFPVFFLLSDGNPRTRTGIAKGIVLLILEWNDTLLTKYVLEQKNTFIEQS